MRYLPTVLAGVAAVAIAGSAALAAGNSLPLHHMTVRLPDSGSIDVAYAGNVPPRVTVDRSPFDVAWPGFPDFSFGPSSAEIQRISADMERQMNTLMHQAQTSMRMAAPGSGSDLLAINAGDLPAGSMSYSFVSTSNGHTMCSRSVEVTKPANGAKPKVVTHSSGNCKGLPKNQNPAADNDSI
jgi:hypothetical protein